MQNIPSRLRSAQNEVRRTAHDQDLIEVPKRAKLDRDEEAKKSAHGLEAKDKQ
jgi:hypothetical protein